jgi:hypothetical protein
MANEDVELEARSCQTCGGSSIPLSKVHELVKRATGPKPIAVDAIEENGRKKLVFWPLHDQV